MLNNGNGTFGPKTDFPVVTYTQDVAAGDFNGDGKIDLAVTIQSPQISLAIPSAPAPVASGRRRIIRTPRASTYHRCWRRISITTPGSMS